MDKKKIREQKLQERLQLSAEEVKRNSQAIVASLKELPLIKSSERIHIYFPIKNEVDLRPLLEYFWDVGKKVVMPRVNHKTKELDNYFVISYGQLEKTHFGLHEPTVISPIHFGSPDVILVPGVAFDNERNRLGYGGGYYDRYLRECLSLKIGVAYEMQIVDKLLSEERDQKVDMIVTEKRIIK